MRLKEFNIEIYNKIYEFANQFHRAEDCGILEKK